MRRFADVLYKDDIPTGSGLGQTTKCLLEEVDITELDGEALAYAALTDRIVPRPADLHSGQHDRHEGGDEQQVFHRWTLSIP